MISVKDQNKSKGYTDDTSSSELESTDEEDEIVNPKFDNIGFVLEMRYIFNDYTRGQATRVKPDVRFNSLAFLAGLSFHF